MMEWQYIVAIYLGAINFCAFVLYGIDKWKSKRDKWRITEATLLLIAFFGGSLGAWLGMTVWNHKTKHLKFRLLIPLFFLVHLGLAVYIILHMG